MDYSSVLDESGSPIKSASKASSVMQNKDHFVSAVPETNESSASLVAASDLEVSFVPSSQAIRPSGSSKKSGSSREISDQKVPLRVVEESSDDSVIDVSLVDMSNDRRPPLCKPYPSRGSEVPPRSEPSFNSSIIDATQQSISSDVSPTKFDLHDDGATNRGPTTSHGLLAHQRALVSTPTLDPSTPTGRWRESATLSDNEKDSPVLPLRKSDAYLPDLELENELECLMQNSNRSSSKMSTPKNHLTKQFSSDSIVTRVENNESIIDSALVDDKLISNLNKREQKPKNTNSTSLDSSAQNDSLGQSPVIVKHKRRPCVVIDSDDEDHVSSIEERYAAENNASNGETNAPSGAKKSSQSRHSNLTFHDSADASIEDASMLSGKYGGKYVIKKKHHDKGESSRNKQSSSVSVENVPADTSYDRSNSSLAAGNSSVEELQSILDQKKKLMRTVDLHKLPDKGERIKDQISELEQSLSDLSMNTSIQENSVSLADSSEESIVTVPSSSESESPKPKFKSIQSIPWKSSNVYRYEPPPSLSPEKIAASKQESAMDHIADLKDALKRKKEIFKASNLRHLGNDGEQMKKEINDLERELMLAEIKAGPTVVRQDALPKYEQKPLEKLPSVNTRNVNEKAAGENARYMPPNMPQHVVDALYAAENNYGGRNYGGKLSHAREREMVRVTSDTLEHFNDMIKSMPDVDNLDPSTVQEPKGLKVDLMPHQKRALAWLLWRESQDPPGGILADDMGLGKTLTMLALILRHRELLEEGLIQDFAEKVMGAEHDDDEDEESSKGTHGWLSRNRRQKLKKTHSTLVVCPASLIGQWEREAHERVSKRSLSVLVYHGTRRNTSLRSICQHDVVVTTYQLAMKEAFGKGGCSKKEKMSDKIPNVAQSDQGSLYQIGWARIILDEAHVIRNHKSQTAQAMCMLKGGRRWAVTGTPVQNKETDVFSLIRFLRLAPFDDYTCWKHQIENSSVQGLRRLNIIMKAVLLRRTKDQVDKVTGEQLVKLPEKTIVEHKLCLSQEERQIYDRVFTFSKNSLCEYMKSHEQKEMEKLAKTDKDGKYPAFEANQFTPTLNLNNFVDSGIKTHHLLVLLLRLRQICCHPTLVKAMICDDDEDEAGHNVSEAEKEGLEVALLAQLQDMTLQDVDDIKKEAQDQLQQKCLTLSNPVFNPETSSSKIERIIEELVQIKQKGRTDKYGKPDPENGFREKAVIVSQWTSMLQIVRDHLRRSGMKTHIIDGTVPVKDRSSIVADFNNNPKGPKVLLLSLGAGGVGLNLIGANHLFLLDMHWNPQLEAQACDRIYRVGQTRPVYVHRFVVENTVEMKILELQKKKLQLADDVLSGAKRRGGDNKLTLNELKNLFNIA